MMISLYHPQSGCSVIESPLTPSERNKILGDEHAMRAVTDGSHTLPPARWTKFYIDDETFCGAVAKVSILKNPLQVEFHLFFLSTAPLKSVRVFCELAYIHSVLLREMPYTVVQAHLTYMVNFMRKMSTKEIPKHGKYFYFTDDKWKPKYATDIRVVYLNQ